MQKKCLGFSSRWRFFSLQNYCELDGKYDFGTKIKERNGLLTNRVNFYWFVMILPEKASVQTVIIAISKSLVYMIFTAFNLGVNSMKCSTLTLMNKHLSIIFVVAILAGCETNFEPSNRRFNLVDPESSGVTFENRLTVTDSMNYLEYGYYYLGGGVAVGDVNGDSLQDIYFTGNMVENKLYLNQGNLKFKDISQQAKVQADDRWVTGVSMADINADGLMDIYVSVSGKWQSTKNICYINQGNDENGIPTFVDRAEEMGLADEGNTIQTLFFDYDMDGDIDVFVCNYPITKFKTLPHQYRWLMDNLKHNQSDHLYRNDGQGKFSDVTKEAGLFAYGLTLGAVASDFNNDGLVDVYLSSDFNSPDFFYLNNGDGTFRDVLQETTQHTSFFGMGVDAADYNNDGLLDIFQADMSPVDNYRSKANMASMDTEVFWETVGNGLHHQYMYNTLQRNNGVRENGLPFFSDVAKIDGLDKTDWSWASLLVDLDNDGYKDAFVSNGIKRDISNKDYFEWLGKRDTKIKYEHKVLNIKDLINEMPSQPLDNYVFRNIGGHSFERINKSWGIQFEGFSNGVAYADLDNDGDLELVLNNVDSVACIFENLSTQLGNNYLRIKLEGPSGNPLGLNAKVQILDDSIKLYHEHTMVRGYQSSVEPLVHFGLGGQNMIAQLSVVWPDSTVSLLENVRANQQVTIRYSSGRHQKAPFDPKQTSVFQSGEMLSEHEENEFNDFEYEVLLPHKMSQFGPALAVGDVNGDGRDDFYLGGAADLPGKLLIQNVDGTFAPSNEYLLQADQNHEDIDALFFDADNDSDMDLYVVSGSNEYETGSSFYLDRLYLNDGQGKFVKGSLPNVFVSGGVVKASDYDKDGDLDLFIGGRQSPGRYPEAADSYILQNNSSGGVAKFIDVTEEIAPVLKKIGMVTDALWQDYDLDGDQDLIVVGEWMPITVLENQNGKYSKVDDIFKKTVGWWNTIASADFDNDGDEDWLVGNLGLNYKYKASPDETFDVYANDYDQNGKLDIVLGYYQAGVQYPVRGKQCSSEQVPGLKQKFKSYDQFASASLSNIYEPDLLGQSLHYQAHIFASVYVENLGNGNYEIHQLPIAVQASSINSFLPLDYNHDGNMDVVCGGNLFMSEVETPRNDACFGWLLKGDGNGQFEEVPFSKSGLYVPYDIRKIAMLGTTEGQKILFANNDGPLVSYQLNGLFIQ